MIKQLQTQFYNLTRREQRLLATATPLVLGFALWLLLLKPLQTEQIKRQAELENKQLELAWMQAATYQLRELRELQTGTEQPEPGASSVLLIQQLGIKTGQVKKIDSNRVSINITDTPYKKALRLIEQLEQQYSRLDNVDITANRQSGRVAIRLTISRQELE